MKRSGEAAGGLEFFGRDPIRTIQGSLPSPQLVEQRDTFFVISGPFARDTHVAFLA